MKKVIVAHPGQQHSFRLATAIKRRDMLYKYMTTVYDKRGSLTRASKAFLKGDLKSKAEGRKCKYLDDEEVIQKCEFSGLVLIALQRVMPKSKLCDWWARYLAKRFEIKAAKYAIRQDVDALVVYDTNGVYAGRYLRKRRSKIKLIMDVAAADRNYMREIYKRDMQIMPHFAKRMRTERSFFWNDKTMQLYKEEVQYPDAFLVPSNFVKKTLKYSGASENKIFCCPYGVDTAQFKCKNYDIVPKLPLRFIYVGGVKELKGIAYLLDAFAQIPEELAKLTVVGGYNPSDEDLQQYLSRVDFTGVVLHQRVSELLESSDVYIFPSLGEGLSLSTLEAASCGLPLIVTANSGVDDGMTEGKEGFVVPIQSVDALKDKIMWFVNNPDQIAPMGYAAREMALNYTWERYYDRMGETIAKIVM